ncbi:MAG TPA: AraC family transcriptional regulator [Casimicrobiaceae bacterium]|jgi:AraC-like DNA-binding protein|nr:AraC family transcriptional regulator [Casimicrobiaceae bacterium]
MRDKLPNTPARPSAAIERWGQHVGSLTEIPALLGALGADPAAVLASAGLSLESLSAPQNRIDYGAFGRLLANGARATGHEQFGLMVGRMYRLSSVGLLGEIVRNCSTLGEALQLLTVHQHINSAGGIAFMLKRGAAVDLGHVIYYPGVEGVDQISDGCLAAGFNYVRELVGPAWRPTQVFLPHARPRTSLPYRQFFGTEPQFNADMCAMRFPAYWLDHPVAGASEERKRFALAAAEAIDPGVVIKSYRGLRTLLMSGKCSGDDLAQMLSLHRRTLNRRLEDAGTTFQAVLDDVRFEAARQLLLHTNQCMDDIAAALGYSAVAPFMRSFRRWSGETPGRWRRRGPQPGSVVEVQAAARPGARPRLAPVDAPVPPPRDNARRRAPLRSAA